jgi:prephenate dehydratase
MSGSYAKEKAEIADHVAKVAGLVAEIQQKAAKLGAMPITEATVGAVAEAVDSLRWDCSSVDSQMKYIRELQEVIAKGQ